MIKKILFKNIVFSNLNHSNFNKIINKKGYFTFPSGPGLALINISKNYLFSLQKSDLVFFDSGFLSCSQPWSVLALMLCFFSNSRRVVKPARTRARLSLSPVVGIGLSIIIVYVLVVYLSKLSTNNTDWFWKSIAFIFKPY